jgi:phage shock protein E
MKRKIPSQRRMIMKYTSKFQAMADQARAIVQEVAASDVDALIAAGAVPLDIRDKEEHDAGHIPQSVHVSRGKLEMNIEAAIADLDTTILCYCNANNRGALSAASLRAMGYRNAKFIAGGLNAYHDTTAQ